MADKSVLDRLQGQQGPGIQLPPYPRIPLPDSLKKICPELNDWEARQSEAEREWVKKLTFNVQ